MHLKHWSSIVCSQNWSKSSWSSRIKIPQFASLRLNFRILCWLIHQNKPKAWCILLCRLQGNPAARRLQSAEGGVGQLSQMSGKKSTTVETEWCRCMWPPWRKSDAKGGIGTCSNQNLKAWHKAYADKTITCVPCTVFDLVVHIDSLIFKLVIYVLCIVLHPKKNDAPAQANDCYIPCSRHCPFRRMLWYLLTWINHRKLVCVYIY